VILKSQHNKRESLSGLASTISLQVLRGAMYVVRTESVSKTGISYGCFVQDVSYYDQQGTCMILCAEECCKMRGDCMGGRQDSNDKRELV
jgi:hypothetical protein